MPLNDGHGDIELWARIVDDDGEERFEKIHKLTDEEVALFEAEGDEEDSKTVDMLVELIKQNFYLEGMVSAYEKMLGIDEDCEDE